MKRPELKMDKPDIKVPPVVEDLYRDLRDRRLLPIVALLLVAIIAVPIALSSGTGSSTAAPVPEVVPADAPEAQAAVLAENPGLRDYRERLDSLKAQNPFEQQFETSGLEGTEVSSGTETLDSVTSGGGEVSAGGDTGASTSEPTSDSTSTSTSEPAPDTSTGSSGSVDTDTDSTSEPEVQFYGFKADLQYGLEGDVREHRNVKYLDMLSPVGTLLGASIDGKKVVFGLSSSVVSVSGDGDCVSSPDACEFLTLEEGKSAVLTYQRPNTEPATYRLTVDDIRIVKLKEPPVFE